jgi:hypothetical protein
LVPRVVVMELHTGLIVLVRPETTEEIPGVRIALAQQEVVTDQFIEPIVSGQLVIIMEIAGELMASGQLVEAMELPVAQIVLAQLAVTKFFGLQWSIW